MIWVVDKVKNGEVAGGKRILKADEFLAIRGSLELVAAAEQEGKKIIGRAKEEAKTLRDDAEKAAAELQSSSQEAFEAEKRRGYEEGLAEGKKEMAGQMVELTAKSIQKFSEFEEAILNIVMRSLRRIVGEIGHTELIKRIVSNALEVVRNQKKAILRVHPDQAPGARESVDDWVKQGNQMELLEVVADNRLEKNACIVETEIGVVDATLDVQLEAIHGILRKKFSGG